MSINQIDLIKLTITEEGIILKKNKITAEILGEEASERIDGHMKVVAEIVHEELKKEMNKEEDKLREAMEAVAGILQELKEGIKNEK